MGSGQGKSRRVQATRAQRQAAINNASKMVRSGRVARAGSRQVESSGFYMIREEPVVGRKDSFQPFSLVDVESLDVVGIFSTLEAAQASMEKMNWNDPRTIALDEERQAELQQEVQVEKVAF